MNRSFVHLELNVQDTAQARDFYGDLFGWEFSDIPLGDTVYIQIKPPSGPGGGIQRKPTPDAPPMWLPYVGVESVRDIVARAREAGARVVADYMAVPGYGALAIIADPAGAWLGLWETADASGATEWSPQSGTVDTPVEAEPKKGPTKKTAKKTSGKKKAAKKTGGKKKTAKKTGGKKKAAKTGGKKKAAKTGGKKKTGGKRGGTKKRGRKRT